MEKRSIFRTVLIPALILALVEIIILLVTTIGQGLFNELHRNEIGVVDEKVISRKGNLENEMLNSWMNFEQAVTDINSQAVRMQTDSGKSMEEVVNDYDLASEFLTMVTPELVARLRNNHVTGAYLILNTEDLEPAMQYDSYHNKYGVYLRNNNPKAHQFVEGSLNVLMMRSPVSVVQALGIPLHSNWDVQFAFGDEQVPYYDFFYRPFQMAYEHQGKYSWKNLGCWNRPFRLEGDTREAITYSVPLILEDGTVYGVMGIDITTDYLESFINNKDLDEAESYFLGVYQPQTEIFRSVVGNEDKAWIEKESEDEVRVDLENYYCHAENLNLYTSNTPFSDEQWVFAGVAPYSEMYSFVNKFQNGMMISVLLMFLVGVIGSLLMSFRIHNPITKLVQEMKKSDSERPLELPPTGILEIDEMSDMMELLSQKAFAEQYTLAQERDHDFLTGLPNRRAFLEKLGQLTEKYADQIDFGAMVMLDLDNLKYVNDNYGHEYGDRYICAAAEVMKKEITGHTIYGRLAGDEFIIFLYGYKNRESLNWRIQELKHAFHSTAITLPDGKQQFLKISGGISVWPEDGIEVEQLIQHADEAMYRVKRGCKDDFMYYNNETTI